MRNTIKTVNKNTMSFASNAIVVCNAIQRSIEIESVQVKYNKIKYR
jgi:hypothetical protein